MTKATDTEGQIAGIPRGGKVTIRVKALNDGNNELIAWMLDPTSPKNVSVKFVNTVDGAAMKELKGTNCYCIDYIEKWEDGQQHYEQIEIRERLRRIRQSLEVNSTRSVK